ncbi:DNA integrity scanning protein DisA nucleotide-binding domain protein [Pedobacter sp. AW31-3R]|uniref:DNA integrity scanning protein DisA nucleotide-binding domain protein n=1 Tax=Pedobacter sp. AW31-3R TaxID=3445781 RepID=UPI003F9FCD84
MNACDHLIWEHQQHCQISLQLAAEELFNAIDERLSPKIFLIGALITPDRDRPFIVLECPDEEYCVQDFAAIKQINLQQSLLIRTADNQEPTGTYDNQENRQQHERLNNLYVTEIQRALRINDGKTNEYFISPPVQIEGYLVYVIAALHKKALNTFYNLSRDRMPSGQKISRSLTESMIKVYLEASMNALKAKSQSDFNVLTKSRDELISKAGHDFMVTISTAGQHPNGLHVLFEACNTISSLKYEGAEGLGKMVIARQQHPNVKITMELENPIHIKDFRRMRKFLELAGNNQMMFSDAVFIYGLCELKGKYNSHDESLFIIHFTKHFHWEVVHKDHVMIAVAFRMPELYSEKIKKEKFYSSLKRVFTGIDRNRMNTLWEVTMEATKQKHGTILAISSDAEREAIRLSSQSFKIKPIKINKELIKQVTSIDGAVLIDTDCTCHAIGVILDGIATDNGDSSRGARYNSAVRYYEYMEGSAKTVLVVISEDGTIDLIPDLKHQIRHSVISKHINALEKLSRTDKFLRKSFHKLMEFFQEHNFYLSDKECLLINKLRRTIEFRHRDNNEGIHIIWNNLVPNKNMNAGYYLKE